MQNIIYLDSIDSTNNYAKQHAAEFPPGQITCIAADEQTAGRGRFHHRWTSPRGVNLYATFYFRLPATIQHLTSIGQVMAYSMAALLIEEGLHPKIKWPNDLYLGDQKFGGILCETAFREEEVEIFLGIGVNVNMEKEALAKIDQPATSLKAETEKPWDRKALLQKLMDRFSQDLATFRQEGFTPFKTAVENLLAYKGEWVRCFDGKQEWVGICHSLTYEGQLNLYMPEQGMYTLLSGEVHLRKK